MFLSKNPGLETATRIPVMHSLAAAETPPCPEVLLPGPQGIKQLAEGWVALQDRNGATPMSRIEWTLAYLDSFAQKHPEQVQIAAVASQGDLTALIPLVQRRTFGHRYLELLGSHELFEPTELLYRDPQALTQLLDKVLRETGQPIVFERHPGNAASLDIITSQLRHTWKVRRRLRPNSPSVSIGDDPEQGLNAGRRSDLRRMLRRAEKYGKVSFRILSPTIEELPSLLETAVNVEAAGWKGKNRSSLQHDIGAKKFFERYATLASKSGIFRMAFMYIDDRPVATQLTVECGDALWLLKIGYDETYADCSPGNLLMMEIIRYASRQKLKSCEFLGKAESWTRMWTNTEYTTECITIFPNRPSYLRHMCVLVLRKVGDALRKKSGSSQSELRAP
jgi:CelD/BcsL family acetyltransferase involved in cellulose biosynthesis